MRISRAWCGCFVVSALATACSIEPAQDNVNDKQKRKPVPGDNSTSLAQDPNNCKFTLSKGCFDGHVVAKTAFFIDGKQFFNADDLAARFKDLINVQADGKPIKGGPGGYQLTLLTPLDNTSYLQGFSFDATGPLARSGNLRSDGNFSIDELPEGNYDLRVQKSVKFSLAQLPASAPPANAPVSTSPAAGPAAAGTVAAGAALAAGPAEPKPKVYCATLYTDLSPTIRAAQRVWNTLSEFHLHVSDNECMNGGNQTVLNL